MGYVFNSIGQFSLFARLHIMDSVDVQMMFKQSLAQFRVKNLIEPLGLALS